MSHLNDSLHAAASTTTQEPVRMSDDDVRAIELHNTRVQLGALRVANAEKAIELARVEINAGKQMQNQARAAVAKIAAQYGIRAGNVVVETDATSPHYGVVFNDDTKSIMMRDVVPVAATVVDDLDGAP